MRFLTILNFLKNHQKIKFWWLRGVTGNSRGQEKSIFDVFGHLKIFENFGKLVNVKKNMERQGFVCRKSRGASYYERCSMFDDFENFGFLSQIARRIFWR